MKCFFGMQINIEIFYKFILSFLVYVTRHAHSTQNKFAYLCNISRKAQGMKLSFCLQINTKVFYKVIVLLWMCIVRHAQSIQNSSVTISLQYFKENIKDEVSFCLLIIVKVFFKFILSFQMCMTRHAQITQNSNWLFLCNTFLISLMMMMRMRRMMKNCFCGMVDQRKVFTRIFSWDHCQTNVFAILSIKVSYKVMLSILLMEMIKHS